MRVRAACCHGAADLVAVATAGNTMPRLVCLCVRQNVATVTKKAYFHFSCLSGSSFILGYFINYAAYLQF